MGCALFVPQRHLHHLLGPRAGGGRVQKGKKKAGRANRTRTHDWPVCAPQQHRVALLLTTFVPPPPFFPSLDLQEAIHGLSGDQSKQGFILTCQTHPVGPGLELLLGQYDTVYEMQYGQYEKQVRVAEWAPRQRGGQHDMRVAPFVHSPTVSFPYRTQATTERKGTSIFG